MKLNKIIIYSVVLSCILNLSCSTGPKAKPWVLDKERIEEMTKFAADSNSVALVTLKVDGKTIPGTPRVCDLGDAASVMFDKLGVSSEIVQTSEGTWITLLEIEQPYVVGWIVEDKKLFGYCSMPFKAAKGLNLVFSPGMPTSLEYDITADVPAGITAFPVEVFLPKKTISMGTETYLSWGERKVINKPGKVRIDGLSPGIYKIIARSVDYAKYGKERIPFLYDKRDIEIKPSVIGRAKVVYPEIDSTVEPGDITVHVLVTDVTKQPFANETMELIPLEGSDPRIDLYYPKKTTDSNGWIEFTGIRPNIAALLKYSNSIAYIGKDEMRPNANISVDMVVGPQMAVFNTDIGIVDLVIDFDNNNTGKLSDLIGKAVVVTFWTNWCKISREALDKLNTMAGQNTQNDIVFLTLSLDADKSQWKKTIEKAGWTNLRHGWFEQQNNPVAINRPIPYSFIMDKNGHLRVAGYNLDIGRELEKIAKDPNSTNH
jgi:hypothetical protein